MLEQPAPYQNHILAALPVDAQNRLFPQLQLVSLPLGKALHECGECISHVYFPTDAIVSLMNVMEDGASAEISAIGNEGLIGVSLFTGGETNTTRAVVLSGGRAYRLSGKRLRDEIKSHSELEHLLLRYMQSMMTQMGQTAVCNRHHSIDQQLCRWLLLSLDRLHSDCLVMTQELISNMLGVRRESVTEAAGKLRRQGVIECHRGKITVLDRRQLEKLSCECYAVLKVEIARLMFYSTREPRRPLIVRGEQNPIMPGNNGTGHKKMIDRHRSRHL